MYQIETDTCAFCISRYSVSATSADGTMDAIEEIRSISNISQRIAEAQRLGFEKCIIPKMSLRQIDPRRYKIGIIAVSNIRQAFDYLKKERGIS